MMTDYIQLTIYNSRNYKGLLDVYVHMQSKKSTTVEIIRVS